MIAHIHDVGARRAPPESHLERNKFEQLSGDANRTLMRGVTGLEQVYFPAAPLEAANNFVHVGVGGLAFAGRLQAQIMNTSFGNIASAQVVGFRASSRLW
jgi:hypothetical protein